MINWRKNLDGLRNKWRIGEKNKGVLGVRGEKMIKIVKR